MTPSRSDLLTLTSNKWSFIDDYSHERQAQLGLMKKAEVILCDLMWADPSIHAILLMGESLDNISARTKSRLKNVIISPLSAHCSINWPTSAAVGRFSGAAVPPLLSNSNEIHQDNKILYPNYTERRIPDVQSSLSSSSYSTASAQTGLAIAQHIQHSWLWSSPGPDKKTILNFQFFPFFSAQLASLSYLRWFVESKPDEI